MITILRKSELERAEKPPKPCLRVYPRGHFSLSRTAAKKLGVSEGSYLVFFRDMQSDSCMGYYVAGQDQPHREGFDLSERGDGILAFNKSGLAGELLDFHGIADGEKSIALLLSPKPYEVRNLHGFALYKLTKI